MQNSLTLARLLKGGNSTRVLGKSREAVKSVINADVSKKIKILMQLSSVLGQILIMIAAIILVLIKTVMH